ncbi:MAG TPA: S8 family serine peptidase, partial [Actinomycetota bacterium]|nr:S8 family serine peptidase [Actinomycetota bacterium]
MGYALTISWDGRRGRVAAAALVASALTMSVLAGLAERSGSVSVIVQETSSAGDMPERVVEAIGGRVGRQIRIINGFVATVPADRVGDLRRLETVRSVTPNGRVQLLHNVDGYNAAEDAGSMFSSVKSVKADMAWASGYTGQGVDVALIDSGVVPVNGLTYPGKVVNGPDLSFESQAEHLTYLDSFGHGTHMAGIIAGRDDGKTPTQGDHDSFMGIAPGARILNIKVANAIGAADVSQVIAAIDWVVQHKNDNGMSVRVLNLSFGTDGIQDYQLDPLAYAAEVAWHNGIVVVVAAGNAGFGNSKLNNPAYDPYVIAVGASDTKGTFATDDDVTPEWTSRGDGTRNPDLVAPGKSIVSLRSPESYSDQTYPGGRVGTRFFRGSGTSQSAAMVSGAVALLVQKHPNATPDQIKKLLMETASPLPVADPVAQGEGVLNLKEAIRAPLPSHTQSWPTATGLGSLEASRGSG